MQRLKGLEMGTCCALESDISVETLLKMLRAPVASDPERILHNLP